ncbi:hypothetical protein N0V95_007847 [Ascochyta clinopodiicola]|nr:hypothetical protein N0V95_007847 [Ascochyta clinopodiicola]
MADGGEGLWMNGLKKGNWSDCEFGELLSEAPSPGSVAEGFKTWSTSRDGDDVEEPCKPLSRMLHDMIMHTYGS